MPKKSTEAYAIASEQGAKRAAKKAAEVMPLPDMKIPGIAELPPTDPKENVPAFADVAPREEGASTSAVTERAPAVPAEREVFQKRIGPLSLAALERLTQIIMNPDSKTSDVVRAAEVVFNRAYGMPKQEVEQQGKSVVQVLLPGQIGKYAE